MKNNDWEEMAMCNQCKSYTHISTDKELLICTQCPNGGDVEFWIRGSKETLAKEKQLSYEQGRKDTVEEIHSYITAGELETYTSDGLARYLYKKLNSLIDSEQEKKK